jgi:hypothetical protein
MVTLEKSSQDDVKFEARLCSSFSKNKTKIAARKVEK